MNAFRILLISLAVVTTLSMSVAALAAPTHIDHSSIVYADSTKQPEPTRANPPKSKTPKPKVADADKDTNNEKVAQAIADFFGVAVAEVDAWHEEGKGYGEIVKAYSLAKMTGNSVESIFDMRATEQGWGQILHSLAADKWETSVGKIMRRSASDEAATSTAPGKSGEHRQDQGEGKDKSGNPGDDGGEDKTDD